MLHIARSLRSPFYSTFPSSSVSPNHNLLILYCCCSVAKLCLSFCDAMDYRPPGSSVHEISQARTLEWAAIPSPYLDLFHLLKPHGKYAQKYLIEQCSSFRIFLSLDIAIPFTLALASKRVTLLRSFFCLLKTEPFLSENKNKKPNSVAMSDRILST